MEEKRHSNFKRNLLLVAIAAVLGGGTLGGGLGVGIAIVRYMLPDTQVQEVYSDESQTIAYTESTPVVNVPIEVQLPDYSDMIAEVKDSVVSINAMANVKSYYGSAMVPSAGSGFIFSIDDENVYVATNNHVVEGTEDITISPNDGDQVPAKIIGRDEASELAVIAVSKEALDATGVPYKAAELGDSSKLSMGDLVVAMGNAMGEGKTATQGMISSTSKQITAEGTTLNVIQTDAAINQGNSGGPLFNLSGEVIGINTAKAFSTGVEGMGYSIPINDAVEILETLRDEGIIDKPSLGIYAHPQFPEIDSDMAAMFNLPSEGVMIGSLIENGGAQKAGIEPMDLIVEFNGEKVETFEGLRELVGKTKVGDTVTVKVYRGNKLLEMEVEIGNANDMQQ